MTKQKDINIKDLLKHFNYPPNTDEAQDFTRGYHAGADLPIRGIYPCSESEAYKIGWYMGFSQHRYHGKE